MAGVLYRKEREVLEFLIQFQNRFGYSPTLQEIAQATHHKAVSTVHQIVRNLVEKGYIQKVEGNNRVLKILDKSMSSRILPSGGPSVDLPLMGFIAAGKPLEPYSDPNATFSVSSSLLSGKYTSYILQVKGSSLIEDGILDGDYVVIEKDMNVRQGDIVVAIVDDNLATLKKYYKEGDRVVLRPANSEMKPIYPTQLTLQGKCVAVVRKFN